MIPLWHVVAARSAIALRRHPGRFPENLEGACCVAAVLLALAFGEYGIPCILAQADVWPHGSHAWVVTGGTPVDITATQFGFDAFVRLRPIVRRRIRQALPLDVFAELRGKPVHRIWHHSEPRRNYRTLVPALAEVLGITRPEARRRVRAAIGPEVHS